MPSEMAALEQDDSDGIYKELPLHDDNNDTSTTTHPHPPPQPMEESHTRSFVKGLTWRILATSTTTLIAWIITGQVDAALEIGLLEFVAKLVLYYLHERLWTQIRI
eukprot:CAMPEP_0168776620 /NCGR_PEP_ID=MMETSP0725-20121227/6132_1 /TAXON_ID=265536 /ORGANISM="Amphiprora sp., Strain CCMP467" /LENGTH=105 /DNA_ID=CAMNT_0008826307 /DNA_START=65 /DNA_END=382 /DNA_ORIENTATION=+